MYTRINKTQKNKVLFSLNKSVWYPVAIIDQNMKVCKTVWTVPSYLKLF